jgi:hypothetical protein
MVLVRRAEERNDRVILTYEASFVRLFGGQPDRCRDDGVAGPFGRCPLSNEWMAHKFLALKHPFVGGGFANS